MYECKATPSLRSICTNGILHVVGVDRVNSCANVILQNWSMLAHVIVQHIHVHKNMFVLYYKTIIIRNLNAC